MNKTLTFEEAFLTPAHPDIQKSIDYIESQKESFENWKESYKVIKEITTATLKKNVESGKIKVIQQADYFTGRYPEIVEINGKHFAIFTRGIYKTKLCEVRKELYK